MIDTEEKALALVHQLLTESLCNYRPHGQLLDAHRIGISHPLRSSEGHPMVILNADDRGYQLVIKEVTGGTKET